MPPDGSQAGKPFDLVCTFEVASNGNLLLTKLGDQEMDHDESKESDSKPDYGNYSKGLMSGMMSEGSQES